MIDITDKLDLIKDKIKDFFLKKNLCQDNKKTSHRVGESAVWRTWVQDTQSMA